MFRVPFLATVAVSYSVVSVVTLDGVLLGLLDDGLLDGSSLGSLDGVSLGLLDGSLDRSSLGSLDGDEGGGSSNDDKTATTEENKYFGFVRSPDLFVCKVKAAATMTRQPRQLIDGRRWSPGIYRALRLHGRILEVAWEGAFV